MRRPYRGWFLLGVALLLPAMSTLAAPQVAERIGREERLLGPRDAPPRHDGTRWIWDDLTALAPPPGCEPSGQAETLLASPRVDLFRCQAGFPKTLVGVGPDGTRWHRALRHPSGGHAVDLYVGTANPQRITLDTLETLDPANGKTLAFAPMRMVDTPSRAMPVVRITGPVACPADRGDCFGAIVEGEPAGLLRISRDGQVTVLEKPQTKWFAPIAIADIRIAGDRLLLAEEWLYRGTKWVRFAVVDASSGKRMFEERHGEDRVVSAPRIVAGENGEVAFIYRDATAGRQVMVRYRIAP